MGSKEQDLQWFWSRLETYLDRENLKQSKQRNRIIELFIEMNDHVSAEELHQYALSKDVPAGLATIYRTLKLLKDASLVDQKQFEDGKFVFEIDWPHSHHDHLICQTCERVIEFENQEIERLQNEVAKAYGFRLTNHRLDLWGECLDAKCEYRPK